MFLRCELFTSQLHRAIATLSQVYGPRNGIAIAPADSRCLFRVRGLTAASQAIGRNDISSDRTDLQIETVRHRTATNHEQLISSLLERRTSREVTLFHVHP